MDPWSCFICNNSVNEKAPPPEDPGGLSRRRPGPASSKGQKRGTVSGKQGLPRSLTVTFCKALNIPQEDFKKRLIKSPVCKDCCKRIQNMTHIITALESLQDTVRQFRTEVRDLLETSYEDTTKLDIPVVVMTDPDPDPPVIPEMNDKDTKNPDADETDDCKPKLVLVGNDSEPSDPGCQTDPTAVETSNLLLQNRQNECRKQILDILNRRFARVKVTKPKELIEKPKDVNVKLETSTRKIGLYSPTKKIKTELLFPDDTFEKKLIIPLERLDITKYRQSLVNPVITGVRSIPTKSVTFNDPAASPSGSYNDDFWQPSVEDVNDFNNFSDGTFDEPDYVIVPSPAPSTINEVVPNTESNVKSPIKKDDVKKKKRRAYQDDRSGAETSAYFDSSDPEDDGDLAPSRRKRRKKKFVGDHFCQVCERNFKDEFILDIHMKRRHEGVKYPFLCTEEGCTKAFRQRYLWDHHLNEHRTGEKTINKYVCDTCGKGFSTSNSMNRHASSHTGKWKFPCTICTKGFHRPSELANHLHKHVDPKHCCKFCGQKFDKKHLLVTHMVESHPDEDFKEKRICNICNKVFSGSDALKCHQIQIHQVGECKFTCDICLRGYAKLSWLNRHKLSHTMEKTMICDHEGCGESFRFAASLRVHKMKHEGTYPHCCDICGRKFILKQALEQHLSTHSKDKNFLCNFCGRSFSNKYYLTLHVRRVHWEEIGLDERPKYLSKPKPSRSRPKKPSESKSIKKKIQKMKRSDSSEGEYSETETEDIILGDIIESEDDIDEQDRKNIVIIGTIEGLRLGGQLETEEETQEIHQDEIDTQRIESIETDPFIEFVVTDADVVTDEK